MLVGTKVAIHSKSLRCNAVRCKPKNELCVRNVPLCMRPSSHWSHLLQGLFWQYTLMHCGSPFPRLYYLQGVLTTPGRAGGVWIIRPPFKTHAGNMSPSTPPVPLPFSHDPACPPHRSYENTLPLRSHLQEGLTRPGRAGLPVLPAAPCCAGVKGWGWRPAHVQQAEGKKGVTSWGGFAVLGGGKGCSLPQHLCGCCGA